MSIIAGALTVGAIVLLLDWALPYDILGSIGGAIGLTTERTVSATVSTQTILALAGGVLLVIYIARNDPWS